MTKQFDGAPRARRTARHHTILRRFYWIISRRPQVWMAPFLSKRGQEMLFCFTLWAMTNELMLLKLTTSCESGEGDAAAFRWKRRSESIFRSDPLHPAPNEICPCVSGRQTCQNVISTQTYVWKYIFIHENKTRQLLHGARLKASKRPIIWQLFQPVISWKRENPLWLISVFLDVSRQSA